MMKVWSGYGSEHSANLVMIGKFESPQEAYEANKLIRQLMEQVRRDEDDGLIDPRSGTERFGDAMMKLLTHADLYTLAPSELQQFNYEFDIEVEDSKIVVRTDEVDISALLKVLIRKGARVEVYSAHDHQEVKGASK